MATLNNTYSTELEGKLILLGFNKINVIPSYKYKLNDTDLPIYVELFAKTIRIVQNNKIRVFDNIDSTQAVKYILALL